MFRRMGRVHAVQEWLLRHGPQFGFHRARLKHAATGHKQSLCNVPLEIVEPAMWKRALRLPGRDKEAARQKGVGDIPAGGAVDHPPQKITNAPTPCSLRSRSETTAPRTIGCG